jgi:hypothetical protein
VESTGSKLSCANVGEPRSRLHKESIVSSTACLLNSTAVATARRAPRTAVVVEVCISMELPTAAENLVATCAVQVSWPSVCSIVIFFGGLQPLQLAGSRCAHSSPRTAAFSHCNWQGQGVHRVAQGRRPSATATGRVKVCTELPKDGGLQPLQLAGSRCAQSCPRTANDDGTSTMWHRCTSLGTMMVTYGDELVRTTRGVRK